MNTWQLHLSNWQGVGPVWAISISFVYIGLLIWAFLQSHKLNLTYCLKSSVTCILPSVCLVDQTQMYPSSISLLGLFQGIICNIHSVNPFIYRGLRFSKNHKKGIKEDSCKMSEGVAHIRWVNYRKGDKHWLVMYEFCSRNALYSASISFKIKMLVVISD